MLVDGLFLVIGNVMGKLRPNYTVGIRTPWTLANDRVWDQTHRFGGKTFVFAGGLLCVLAALPLDLAWPGLAGAGHRGGEFAQRRRDDAEVLSGLAGPAAGSPLNPRAG